MNASLFPRRTGRWTGGTAPAATRASRLVPLLGGAAILAMFLFLAGMWLGGRDIGRLQATVADLTKQRAALANQIRHLMAKHCSYDSRDVALIKRLIDEGRYRSAADIAQVDLTNPNTPVCPQSGLPGLWYSAAMDDLLSTTPAGPDDTTTVVRWQSINDQADRFGLDAAARVSPVSLAATSYQNGLWELCRAALIAAVQSSLLGPGDRAQWVLYASALRNEGHALAFWYSGRRRARGITLLATAAAIQARLGTGGEARADLTALLGPGGARSAHPDTRDPVLRLLRVNR